MSNLEDQFNKQFLVKNEINDKLKQALKLIVEAKQLAENVGLTLDSESESLITKIFSELDLGTEQDWGGWEPSRICD